MKRIISMILCVLMLASAFAIVPASAVALPAEDEVINTLGILEIMNGDNYGNLNLENGVTRAEFVKMALCASTYKDKITTGSNVALYTDVRPSHWAVGYITTAVNAGVIKGYLDGTFRPSAGVKLEEAVTVMLRIMGYSELDSGKYPDSQLAKYSELGMDSGISAKRGEALTRRDCMYLIYNALCSDEKSGKPYCQSLGYSVNEFGRIDYNAIIKSKMKGPYVYEQGASVESLLPFDTSLAKVFKENVEISLGDIRVNDVYYYSATARMVWVFDKRVTGLLESISPNRISPSSVTVNGTQYSLESAVAKDSVSNLGVYNPGDTVTLLFGKDGGVVKIVDANLENTETYGFIKSLSEKAFTRVDGTQYISDTVEITGLDGKSYTYAYSNGYFNKGEFVRVSYDGGKLTIEKISTGVKQSEGEEIAKLVSKGKFTDDALIADVYITTDSDSVKNKTVNIVPVFSSRLQGAQLRPENILFASVKNGYIEKLILDSYTGDVHTYGIVITEKKADTISYILIDTNGEKSVQVEEKLNTPTLGPAKFVQTKNGYTVTALTSATVDKGGFNRASATCRGKALNYSAEVKFFIRTEPRVYEPSSYDEIATGDYTITVWYDKEEKNGGRVGVVLAMPK